MASFFICIIVWSYGFWIGSSFTARCVRNWFRQSIWEINSNENAYVRWPIVGTKQFSKRSSVQITENSARNAPWMNWRRRRRVCERFVWNIKLIYATHCVFIVYCGRVNFNYPHTCWRINSLFNVINVKINIRFNSCDRCCCRMCLHCTICA